MEHIGIRAEAAVTDRDPPLVTQRGGDKAVMQAADHKAREREPVRRGPRLDPTQDAYSWYPAQAVEQPAAERHFVLQHLAESELGHGLDGNAQRHGADDIG